MGQMLTDQILQVVFLKSDSPIWCFCFLDLSCVSVYIYCPLKNQSHIGFGATLSHSVFLSFFLLPLVLRGFFLVSLAPPVSFDLASSVIIDELVIYSTLTVYSSIFVHRFCVVSGPLCVLAIA